MKSKDKFSEQRFGHANATNAIVTCATRSVARLCYGNVSVCPSVTAGIVSKRLNLS